ncbi:hypothetical protein FACS1894152_5970 [Bacilli bacterium]|nr:hypothetical protein FACS1894152_5970 [Bacilli bacterium]
MIKSFKVKLKTNNKTQTFLKKNASVSRFAYNWSLARNKENYELNKDNPDKSTHFLSHYDLRNCKKIT